MGNMLVFKYLWPGSVPLRTVIQGAGAGVILKISLPGNIISLYICNNVETPVVIETSTVNSGVTKKF